MLLEMGYERKDICGSQITTIISEQAFYYHFFEDLNHYFLPAGIAGETINLKPYSYVFNARLESPDPYHKQERNGYSQLAGIKFEAGVRTGQIKLLEKIKEVFLLPSKGSNN